MESFTLHGDKAVMSEVRLASWSPINDLLAVVFDDGPLTLYRLSWQRLWTTTPEWRVTCLCWRPDGGVLAAGMEDGVVVLYRVEDGSLVHREAVNSDPILALGWVEEVATPAAFGGAGRLHKLFPPIPDKQPKRGEKMADVYKRLEKLSLVAYSPWEPDAAELNVLVGADVDGKVYLYAYGKVALAEVDTKKFMCVHISELKPLQVAMTRDLHHLVAIQRLKKRKAADSGLLQALVCQCTVVGMNRQHLHQLALRMSRMVALLEVAEAVLKTAGQQWRQARSDFENKMSLLESLLHEHGLNHIDATTDLITLLVGGCMSEAMEKFLTADLGEFDAKRLAEEMDSALQLIDELMLQRFQLAIEMAVLLVEELVGLTKFQKQTLPDGFGLEENDMNAIAVELRRLQLRSELFGCRVREVGIQYRLFFVFLLNAIQMERGSSERSLLADTQDIANFIEGEFGTDSLWPELDSEGSTPLVMTDTTNSPDLTSLVEKVLEGKENCQVHGLSAQLANVIKLYKYTFNKLKTSISEAILPLQQVSLASSLRDVEPVCIALGLPQTPCEKLVREIFIGFRVDSIAKNCSGLVLTKLCQGEEAQDKLMVDGALVRLPLGQPLVDLCFYQDRRVLLLLGEKMGAIRGAGAQAQVLMFCYSEMRMQRIGEDGCRKGVFEVLCSDNPVDVPDPTRWRNHVHRGVRPPLAVSRTRGVGCVFSPHRVVLYDFEADIEEAEEG